MRLWSLNPSYLDSKGLVALWREGLLAQKVLLDQTRGYKNHPQLVRFRESENPVGAISAYLRAVASEADLRNYNFDKSKIHSNIAKLKIAVTNGQLRYELSHLLNKLKQRDYDRYIKYRDTNKIAPHPTFAVIYGAIEKWEIVK